MKSNNDIGIEKESENEVFFKSIDEIIDDLKESATNEASTTSSTAINNKSNKLDKCNRKRRIVSYKLQRAKRYNNRRKARKTK